MSTSGTYNYNPGLGELVLYAFNLCGVRSTALMQEHMTSANMAANMMLGRWSSQGVNLWAVDLQTIPLVAGQATYTVLANTIVMLDSYVVTAQGTSTTNRLVMPISRSEYASYPNPTQSGFPTVYWFDRLLAPTVTLYPVPDGNEVSFNFYRVRQIQDATAQGNANVEIPYYFLEAFAYGLAYRLALIWAPDKAAGLKQLADEAYDIAAAQNIETAAFYISPIMAGYFRV